MYSISLPYIADDGRVSPPASPRFSYKSDRLKPLRAFCQTVRLGSVSRAAEALFVSQPAITLQLQALERDLGTPLLERSGRRLLPTREGELLYEMALPLVEQLDGLENAFRERVRGLDAGELRIAANSSTILYLLPKIVAAFRQQHPEVHLVLSNVVTGEGAELLREDKVDLVVGTMLDVPADLSYEAAHRFEQRLVAPPGHPLLRKARLELSDLSGYPLILPPQRQVTWRLVDLVLQQNRIPYTVGLEVSGWDVIKQYVAMGLGVSIIPSICLGEGDDARLGSRSLAAFFPSRSYGVVVRKGRVLSPQARAFIALIRPDLLAPREYDQSGHSER